MFRLKLTCAGRFLDQFGVVCAFDHGAIGAGSMQHGVHSHSDILHQIKRGAVCVLFSPDSLPIQTKKKIPANQIRLFP